MFNKHVALLSRDPSCGQAPFKSLASLPPNRSSFHLTHLWRPLLEASLFSPMSHLQHSHQRARKGLKAGTVSQSHTPLHPAWDGANTHQACTPQPQGTGCLDSVFPHHLLPCRGRKRPQLYKHYTSTFCNYFQSPVLLDQSRYLSAQPRTSRSPLARRSEIYRPR